MGRSRYAGSRVIDAHHYATWVDPTSRGPLGIGRDPLEGVQTVEHRITLGERLDTLAHRYYGDSDYWWVIAAVNGIQDPFKVAVGTRLRVPLDVRSVIDRARR